MTDKKTQAYQDYAKGMKYADIADKYGVTESAVKQWARRDWKNENVTLDKKVTSEKVTKPEPRKRGGANNVKHGAYKKVSWEILEDDEEEVLIENIDYTPEEMLKNNYKDLLLKKRRLAKLIKQVKEEAAGNKGLILAGSTKTLGSNAGGGGNKAVTVAEENVYNSLRVYESEYSKAQAQITKLAVELAKIAKEENERNNTVIDDWISAVLEDN